MKTCCNKDLDFFYHILVYEIHYDIRHKSRVDFLKVKYLLNKTVVGLVNWLSLHRLFCFLMHITAKCQKYFNIIQNIRDSLTLKFWPIPISQYIFFMLWLITRKRIIKQNHSSK